MLRNHAQAANRWVVAGGDGRRAQEASIELYDPATGDFSPGGSLAIGRRGHTATRLENGTILVAGGSGADIGPLSSAELYDPVTQTFTLLEPRIWVGEPADLE